LSVIVAIPVPLIVVLKTTGCSILPKSVCTNIEPFMTKGEVMMITGSVEFGMTTPGPLKERTLSRANHHAPIVMPLKVAAPGPSRNAVLFGNTVAPGGQGSKAHGE